MRKMDAEAHMDRQVRGLQPAPQTSALGQPRAVAAAGEATAGLVRRSRRGVAGRGVPLDVAGDVGIGREEQATRSDRHGLRRAGARASDISGEGGGRAESSLEEGSHSVQQGGGNPRRGWREGGVMGGEKVATYVRTYD